VKSKIDYPDFLEEKRLWRKGYKCVIGVDEVGRGAFAGPVVVGAVVFPRVLSLRVNDSKLLKARQREQLAEKIRCQSLAWEVAETEVGVINRIGIGEATMRAMRKAVLGVAEKLHFASLFVLVDHFYVPYLKGVGRAKQKPIKKGDKKSFTIAAASILAKVYRDRLMRRISRKFPQFGWGRNKGYGTLEHRKALLKYGPTKLHRRQFIQTWLSAC
jgi:ribonuclease HII